MSEILEKRLVITHNIQIDYRFSSTTAGAWYILGNILIIYFVFKKHLFMLIQINENGLINFTSKLRKII